jgi:hypothetical protein
VLRLPVVVLDDEEGRPAMTQLTYDEAQGLLDTTEMGYTVASQDRLWTVFTFDLWSEDEYRYNRLYSMGIGRPWAYDADGGDLFWTTRREAEAFADALRVYLSEANKTPDEPPEVYVMNWGDDARLEALFLGGRPGGVASRTTPKFAGSRAAWDAVIDMHRRWRRGP